MIQKCREQAEDKHKLIVTMDAKQIDSVRPWQGPAILHVDLDAFFAAVEQLDHPEWRGKPVIIGGSPKGRGVVSTASYEARRYGIRSAMPAARAARLAPDDAIWARPRFERYKAVSAQVFAIFQAATPFIQPLSIDEAFLDVTPGTHGMQDPVKIAVRIAEEISQLGITCSVGVASCKTVAKIASDFNKPCGLTVVYPGQEASFLAALPIGSLSGIGPRTTARLSAMGIATLGELASLDEVTASEVLGPHGDILVRHAAGLDKSKVQRRKTAKSISNERTFPADIRDARQVDSALEMLAAKVTARLRKKKVTGGTVHIKVRFSDFTTRTIQRSLSSNTEDERRIADVAKDLLRQIWSEGVGVRLLGVGITGLSACNEQLDLFIGNETPGEHRRSDRDRLLKEVDAIRERFGDDAIRRGAAGLKPKRPKDYSG